MGISSNIAKRTKDILMISIADEVLDIWDIKKHYVKIPHNPTRIVEFNLMNIKHWPIYNKKFYSSKDLINMAFGC